MIPMPCQWLQRVPSPQGGFETTDEGWVLRAEGLEFGFGFRGHSLGSGVRGGGGLGVGVSVFEFQVAGLWVMAVRIGVESLS